MGIGGAPATRGRDALRARRVGAWGAAALVIAALWASYVPTPYRGRLDAFSPFTQMVAFRPLAAAIVAVAGIGVVALRRGRTPAPVLAALVAATAACAQVVPREIPHRRHVAAGTPTITILTANTYLSSVRPGVIVDLVRQTGADVVALPEANGTWVWWASLALAQSGLGRWRALTDPSVPPGAISPRSTSMLVREELLPVQLPTGRRDPDAHGQVRVRVTIEGQEQLDVAAVHPVPPPPHAASAAWRRDILALRALCRGGWVLAGDFNATIDHSPMRALKRSGCTDSASSTGHGLSGTWHGGPFGLLRPAIDHIMASRGWSPVRSGVLSLPGSDHRALWAELVASRPSGGWERAQK